MMRKQGKGAIVNISSGTALLYLPTMSAYSSSKRALVGFSLTAREELKHDHISVGVVYPYITLTDFERNTLKDGARKEWRKESGANFKLADADTPEFVAEKILEAIETEAAEVFVHEWMN